MPLQRAWFSAQLDLACEIGKPLYLHERLCFDEVSEELEARKDSLPPVLVHCFTGGERELQWYVDFGCYLGFTGFICNRKRAAELRECLQQGRVSIPLDRVMIETDAPYMGFKKCRTNESDNRKKTSPNVPSALPMVLDELAALLEVPVEELAERTTANAQRFFRLP